MGLLKTGIPGGTHLLKEQLSGSTLVETIVASVIFLCVFGISMETVSRLTVSSNESMILIEADYRIKECFREYGNGKYEGGIYTREYHWGKVTVVIRPYAGYPDLQELTITAHMEGVLKELEFKHIIKRQNEQEQ